MAATDQIVKASKRRVPRVLRERQVVELRHTAQLGSGSAGLARCPHANIEYVSLLVADAEANAADPAPGPFQRKKVQLGETPPP